MMRLFCALPLYLALSGAASAKVDIFSQAPDAGAPIRNVPSEAVVADYGVAIDVLGIAENLARQAPDALAFSQPDASQISFEIRRSSLDEGFELDEYGDIRVVPGARAEDLSFHVYGVAHGAELSLLVRRGRPTGSVTGSLARLGQAWGIVESQGRLVLRDLDTTRSPGEPPEVFMETKALPPVPEELTKRAVDGGGTVDVLVLHTQNALDIAGSQLALDDLVAGSFADMEVALANSQAARIRVNHLMPSGASSLFVPYDESPNIAVPVNRWYAHRRWARTSPDATMLRDLEQADLVVLVVGDGASCGVAYTQRPNCGNFSDIPEAGCNVGAAYGPFAVSVISSAPACGLPTRTLAHEVGHQFGLEHDPPNGAPVNQASFPWSYGHTVSNAAVQARTIMAYQTNGACPMGCPIQLHYSNPKVEFQAFPGTPTGTAPGAPQLQSRGNARTSVLLVSTMERFRGPVVADHGVFGHGFEPLPDFPCNPAVWANCPVP